MTTATTMIITSVTLLTGFSSFGLLVLVAGYGTSGLLHPALDLACHRGSPRPPHLRAVAFFLLALHLTMFPTRLPRESNAPSITFALRSGEGHRAMRQEELLGLQWEDVRDITRESSRLSDGERRLVLGIVRQFRDQKAAQSS